jgi:type II secretory pathway pseudopilin PulG
MICRCSRHRSFSYIEAVIALLILSVGLTAGLHLYGSYARGAIIDAEAIVAGELAAELMGEIMSQPYEDRAAAVGSFGLGAGETTRSDFDDVDDYDDWSEDPPAYPDGTALPNLPPGYVRSVVVRNVLPGFLDSVISDGMSPIKRITVTVTRNGKQCAQLVAFRARHDAMD